LGAGWNISILKRTICKNYYYDSLLYNGSGLLGIEIRGLRIKDVIDKIKEVKNCSTK
jgi:hypothetical protein